MRVRLAVLALVVSLCALGQQTLSFDQLLSFIRSSIRMKYQDKEVASYVSKVKLTEQLDERTIEELQGEGLGPKTVAALRELAAASTSLPKPKPPAPKPVLTPIPPPSSEEQQAIIGEVREYAMNYSKSLPDFICTQVTRRYYDPSGLEFWQNMDTITARLSYFEQKEDYKLILVNNRYVNTNYEALGGATSAGEFGSLLRASLDRKADALIEFDRWATLRGKRAYVFAYRVSSAHSEWSIRYERLREIVTGYRGLIYVDKDTHLVLRITLEAIDIPSDFPVQEARTVLDYDYVKIAERPYLLPLKAVVRMRHDKLLTKNDVEFRMYRKFSAEADIKFDTPDPLPEDQTKEQPPK
jgi:hypothetical protein